eukprot:gnl/TRDRNA2_/TRDRNA2_66865_c0_seq1.p1 gnl/TRDRNA2_/TRDRNA2_66865_c0~~gnl/TRDRNA2_/TRDRNA2_66865_c0_seq1.p1  ORF type:complete len:240 (+),score=29.15 gnl/TRDRNA2_/TRDRNA2_66865_c0_seq1:97-816(+)
MAALILFGLLIAVARGAGRELALRTSHLRAAADVSQTPVGVGPHYVVVGSPLTTLSPMMTTHYFMSAGLPPVFTSTPPPTTEKTTTTTTTTECPTTPMMTTTAPPNTTTTRDVVVAEAPAATQNEVSELREEVKLLREEVSHTNQEMWDAAHLIASRVDKGEKDIAASFDVRTLRGRKSGGIPLVDTECSSRRSSCGDCLNSTGCVWCAIENLCFEGGVTGPSNGECSLFEHGSCSTWG